MPDRDTTAVQGVEARGYQRGALATDGWDQYVVPVKDRIVTFDGRSATFQSAGRAVASQKLIALWNPVGSGVLVSLDRAKVDVLSTVIKGIAVIPAALRLGRITVAPTGGTAMPKVAQDTALTSNANVVVLQDQSQDSAASATAAVGTALAATVTGVYSQTWAPRFVTAVGYEPVDTATFLVGEPDVLCRPGEGVVLEVFATTAANNPATDKYIATIDWEEFQRP